MCCSASPRAPPTEVPSGRAYARLNARDSTAVGVRVSWSRRAILTSGSDVSFSVHSSHGSIGTPPPRTSG